MSTQVFVKAGDSLQVAQNDTYSTANGDPLAVDFTAIIPSGVVISSATATVTPSTGLTLSNYVANSSTYVDDDGTTVAIGKAVQFDKATGSSIGEYDVRITATLDTGSTREGAVTVYVE